MTPDPHTHRCAVGEIDYTKALKEHVIECKTCGAFWKLDTRIGWQRNPRPYDGRKQGFRGRA